MSEWREFLTLWMRYIDFHWLFEEVPPRATLFELAAIRSRNTERGLRYLPVYMRRYATLTAVFFSLGFAMESAQAADAAVGACATLCVFAAVALLVTLVGFLFLARRDAR